MASGYALPSSLRSEAADQVTIGTQDQTLPRSGSWISSARGHGHNHTHPAHSRHDSLGTGYHTARSSITSFDRKEVLHGTGVALQHATPPQWADPQANAATVKTNGVLQEIGTGVLVVLPLLTASLLRQSPLDNGKSTNRAQDVQGLKDLRQQIAASNRGADPAGVIHMVEAMILASALLLLLAVLVRLLPGSQPSRMGSEKDGSAMPDSKNHSAQPHDHGASIARRSVPLLLPCACLVTAFYAALQLGGWRISFAILALLTNDFAFGRRSDAGSWSSRLRTHWNSISISCIAALDFVLLANSTTLGRAVSGYAALIVSVISIGMPALRYGLQDIRLTQQSHSSGQRPLSSGSERHLNDALTVNDLFLRHYKDNNTILAAGATLSVTTVLLSTTTGVSPSLSAPSVAVRTISITFAILALYFAAPSSLKDRKKLGFCAGAAMCFLGILATNRTSALATLADLIIASLLFAAIAFEPIISKAIQASSGHSGPHHGSAAPHSTDARFSPFTRFLLQQCEPDSLFHGILMEKDSRRIAYFTCLNFAFMLVQGLYGYLSGSLGLLSDTVHMFFDCLGLIVGLGAAVASKWPRSPERPFGWAKLNTLAGFGNGIFLMLVSVEFAWEAIEGILDGRELRRVKELLVVSTLGLLINLIGLFAFGHAHAGHDHGHSHGHSHGHAHTAHNQSHDHGHTHNHNHDAHSHAHSHDHDHGHEHLDHSPAHVHSHDHNHDAHSHSHNENMHGIFLHVAADAGGSLAVIISTALTLVKPWYLWDPLATIIIATLIFAAAVPLVQSSGRKLLLIIPDEAEHGVKSFLQEVAEVRGALGYAAPRFWLNEQTDDHSHVHDHHHDHHNHHGACAHDHDAPKQASLVGSVHVIAAPFADLDDVRERVQDLAATKGIRATVQVEYETDAHCWCGGSERL